MRVIVGKVHIILIQQTSRQGPAAATSRNFGSGFPSNLYDMKATLAREWDIGYTYLLSFYFDNGEENV